MKGLNRNNTYIRAAYIYERVRAVFYSKSNISAAGSARKSAYLCMKLLWEKISVQCAAISGTVKIGGPSCT